MNERDRIVARLMESASDICPLCGAKRPLVWVADWKMKHRVCDNARWQSIDGKRAFPIYHSCLPIDSEGKTLFHYANKP